MEILLFLLGLVLGALASWRITHIYYKKSSVDQNALFNKLSKEVRDVILNDNRNKLSVLELNELIRGKTIDEEVGETGLIVSASNVSVPLPANFFQL